MAVEIVKKKEMTPHSAAKKFGIPKTTIYEHVRGQSLKSVGRQTVLSKAHVSICYHQFDQYFLLIALQSCSQKLQNA